MMRKKTLRVINQGTRYDITGNLRSFTRRIENGEIVTRDLLIVTREFVKNNASPKVILHHYGNGSVEDIHWMLSTAMNRLEPA
jgi:hypothetical protein